MRVRGVLGVVLAAALLAAPAADARSPKLEVLTGRADLVSGGQALVGVHLPSGADADELRVRANGRDVTSRFRADGADLVKGLVLRLRDGRNVVVASLEGEGSARLRITNHPTGGPMFGGPQTQPWKCQEKAVDKQCNQRAEYSWLYRSTDPTATGLQSFDLENPPSDVATTTTDQGVEVPFVVRDETGYIDRDQYRILVLADPAQKKWSRWSPQPTWNHKVLSPGGGGCGSAYGTSYAPLADFAGTIPSIPGRTDSYVDALGRGFAVMSSALANTGHNCNVVTEAEALMMVKERLTERYGDIRYTIGTGCSGGSVVQHTVSNAYPGAVYDGLIVTCSYPDVLTAGGQFADYHLLRQYFENPARWGPGVVWTPQQFAAVEGHLSHVNAVVADEALFKSATNPIGDCAGEDSYNPQSNPGGVRCSILDFMVNVLGPRPPEVWTEQEKAAGHGFAGVPLDNTGIQYGLGALQSGQITPEQFVDLNEKVGGFDIDRNQSPNRLEGDPTAVANAYRSGLVNEGDHLDEVAIIAHGGPDPGIAHDFAHAIWMRDRLDRYQGNHDNQVLWVGSSPLIGDPTWPVEALDSMDRWLGAVEADDSAKPLARKIVDDRPEDVHDRCSYVPSAPESELDSVCLPDEAHLRLSTPREVAGGDRLNDILKCQLRPIDPAKYGPLGLSGAQLDRLRALFPEGVCDWNVPGVGQQAAIPWQTYQDRRGEVIYGGRALPKAPKSRRLK